MAVSKEGDDKELVQRLWRELDYFADWERFAGAQVAKLRTQIEEVKRHAKTK